MTTISTRSVPKASGYDISLPHSLSASPTASTPLRVVRRDVEVSDLEAGASKLGRGGCDISAQDLGITLYL